MCVCVCVSLSLTIFCLPPKFRTLGLDTDLVSLKLKRNFLCRISEVPQFLSRSGSGGVFFFLLKNKEELLLKKKSGCLELSDGLGWTTTTATTNQPTNKQTILHASNSITKKEFFTCCSSRKSLTATWTATTLWSTHCLFFFLLPTPKLSPTLKSGSPYPKSG